MLRLIVVWSSVTAVGRDYTSSATAIGNSHKKSFGTLQRDCTAGSTWHNIRPEKTQRLLAVKFSVPSLNQKVTIWLMTGKLNLPAWLHETLKHILAERKCRCADSMKWLRSRRSTHWSPAVSECVPCSAPCSPTGWCCILTSPRQTYETAWSAGDTSRQKSAFYRKATQLDVIKTVHLSFREGGISSVFSSQKAVVFFWVAWCWHAIELRWFTHHSDNANKLHDVLTDYQKEMILKKNCYFSCFVPHWLEQWSISYNKSKRRKEKKTAPSSVPVSCVSSGQLMTCSGPLLAQWFAGYLNRRTHTFSDRVRAWLETWHQGGVNSHTHNAVSCLYMFITTHEI